ncbi:MAG: HD domain-containing phosphohydrolase [Rhodocyclaceae bacterium]
MPRSRYSSLAQPLEPCARALIAALDERDGHTREHCDRVVVLATILGVECGLMQKELQLLEFAAAMHDIGKIGIPDHILLKPSGFSPEEWECMKSHTIRGERIVRSMQIEGMDAVATAVRHHHEYFDGSGYPDRLAGEDIPLMSRIVSIVDSYDAMSKTRPYHPPRTHTQVMDILDDEEGGKHDPTLLSLFRRRTERPH